MSKQSKHTRQRKTAAEFKHATFNKNTHQVSLTDRGASTRRNQKKAAKK